MKRVIIYCEGASEETFINKILAPAFLPLGIFIAATSLVVFQNIVLYGKSY